MLLRYFSACLGLTAVLVATARAEEREQNAWPVRVAQVDAAGTVQSWQGAGPLLFRQPLEGGVTAEGFRPIYLRKRDAAGALTESDFIYPIFIYRSDSDSYGWSIVRLINHYHSREGSPTASNDRGFDVWPFYFSRQTDSPESSYRALFPIFGTLPHRLFHDRISWVLFPAYLRLERHGVSSTFTPWPVVRTVHGADNTGFSLWPLFGWSQQPGVYHNEFYLWPFIYNNVSRLGEPVPKTSFGVLPFYASEHSAEGMGESYLWPFFGYSHRTAPYRYDETRYFWPLFLQGRGDVYRNRWAPFYTHSIVKGVDKTWVLWPLFRRQQWTEEGIAQTRTQFLFFLYWSLVQRSATNPRVAPAEKTHYWPVASVWDNGAGRRQVQVLSPIEVFFPHNDNMGLLWSPLFAVYRYDRRSDDEVRHSVLFDLITWRQKAGHREFHLGPLFSTESSSGGRRVTVGNGLLGFQHGAGGGWRPFWFDFSSKADETSAPNH